MYDFIWVWGSKQNSLVTYLCYHSCLDSEKHLGMQEVANRDCYLVYHLNSEERTCHSLYDTHQAPKAACCCCPFKANIWGSVQLVGHSEVFWCTRHVWSYWNRTQLSWLVIILGFLKPNSRSF